MCVYERIYVGKYKGKIKIEQYVLTYSSDYVQMDKSKQS